MDSTSTMPPETMAAVLSDLQAELAGMNAEIAARDAKVASLEDAVTGLAHENALLKRRLYGNRTERSRTSELQVTLGDLLASETKLQAELDESAQALFGDFRGYLQADASAVYDVLERRATRDTDDGVKPLGCFVHCRRHFFEAAICGYPVGLQGLMRIRAISAGRRVPPAEHA